MNLATIVCFGYWNGSGNPGLNEKAIVPVEETIAFFI